MSPCAIVPSCISSLRLGMTKESVGRVVKSVGKLVNGWFAVVETLVKLIHGLCFRA